MAVAALVFYCHGFFSGLNRARKTYEALLGSNPGQQDREAQPEDELQGEETPRKPNWSSDGLWPSPRSRLSGQDLRDDFGNN